MAGPVIPSVRTLRPTPIPGLAERYWRLGLTKPELIYFVIYDYAKKHPTFSLGDLIRHTRKVFAVTHTYRVVTELLNDRWFVLTPEPSTRHKYYRLQPNIWRPTVMYGRAVWKQQELREIDERNVRIVRPKAERVAA